MTDFIKAPTIDITGENVIGRDFVVGDIHGHYDLLMDTLAGVDFDFEKDRLFSVGDLIDRGPKNMECLGLLYEPWFRACVGNHEDMMFEHVLGESYTGVYNWFPNGGGWSEEVDPDELATMVKFAYQTMSLAIETQRGDRRIGFVHASPPNEWTERAIAGWPTHVCWDREIIRYGQPVGECVPEGIDRLYMGHTPVKQPVSRDGCTWLDTGAFATGILTILEI